jgi:hypothetical protein
MEGDFGMASDMDTGSLLGFLERVPAIQTPIGSGVFEPAGWWVKFSIDVLHPLAWRTVQELGHVLNYVSINERLPTVFMPVSPPPYMNGGPAGFLSWVIECHDAAFTPAMAAEWLEGRLPDPVGDARAWGLNE